MPAPRWARCVLEQLHPPTVDDLPPEIQQAIVQLGLRPKPYEPLAVELDRIHAAKVLGIIFDQFEADEEGAQS